MRRYSACKDSGGLRPPAHESEILYAFGGGLTTRDIAEKFGLSGRTVDVHRVNIQRKLGCGSLAEALVKAIVVASTGLRVRGSGGAGQWQIPLRGRAM